MTIRVFATELEAAPEPLSLASGSALTLGPSESHYLWRVRRARPGQRVELLDGVGGVWTATLASGSARACTITVEEQRAVPAPPRALTLVLGLPEPAAALEAIGRSCAVGVSEIVLVGCARSNAKPPGATRRARVLRAVLRQCGRPAPPKIHVCKDLEEALSAREGSGFFAWVAQREREALAPVAVGASAWLAVGPEGGFTSDEAARLRASGAAPMSLGPWVLRTEDATLVALTRLMFAPRPAGRPTPPLRY